MMTCHEYDYIEIVCMQRYPIRLTLKTGDILEGIAFDTQLNQAREECIKVKVDDVTQWIVLDSLSKLEVCVANPHFTQVSFTE